MGLSMMRGKRARGQFYTRGNPFNLRVFRRWAEGVDLPRCCVLEPFAGANHLIEALVGMGLCHQFCSYDVAPAGSGVRARDTIESFPLGFEVCVTNPPWLARNSATRRGLWFPRSVYDDLYKHCLELCLSHCRHVAALLPASYLQSGLFQERLESYVLLHDFLFADTENPTCLALFRAEPSPGVSIYYDDRYIGDLDTLKSNLPIARQDKKIKFNDPRGELGFISFDDTRESSIKFCHGEEVRDYAIKESSRFITRLSGEFGDVPSLVSRLNRDLEIFRRDTADIFLTPFKGMREDGYYRRRMDFHLARRFINAA